MGEGEVMEAGREMDDLMRGLARVRSSGELSDVQLGGFSDGSLAAHRLVLGLRSPVLLEQLRCGGQWSGQACVPFSDIVPNRMVAQLLLDYMYTDQVELGDTRDLGRLALVATLFQAARDLQLGPLERRCSEALATTIRSTVPGNGDGKKEPVVTEPARTAWFSAVLSVLQFSMRDTATEGCVDPELAKTCIDLLRDSTKSVCNKANLLRAMHAEIDSLILGEAAQQCLASICAEVVLACTSAELSMEWGVLSGRADVVVDLLARGVDPDSPSSVGVLPVEMALQLGKGPSTRAPSASDLHTQQSVSILVSPAESSAAADSENDPDNACTPKSSDSTPRFGFVVDWVTQAEMNQIVETLIMGGSRNNAKMAANSGRKSKGPSVNSVASETSQLYKLPMLNLAAKLGNARHVKALLDAGLDVNEHDQSNGRTSLHCAAESGFAEVVQVLLGAGAVPNQQDNNGCTALHLASRRGNLQIVEILQPIVNENIPDTYGWTSLHHAARKGHCEVTRLLLQQSKHPLNFLMATEYKQGSTAVHLAACNAHYRVILVMLDCVRELERGGGLDNLHSAGAAAEARVARGDGVSDLLRVANCKDFSGRSPLHRAAAMACDLMTRDSPDPDSTHSLFLRACKVVESLVDAGASVNMSTKLDYKPLHFALGGQRCHVLGDSSEAQSKRLETFTVAVEGGFATLRQHIQQEVAPQERVRRVNTAKLLSILIGAPGGKATIRAAGKDGVTPLHCAVRYGHITAVPTLVQRGADVNVQDVMGDSPLSLARENWPMPLLANYMLKLIPSPPSWVPDTVEQCQGCSATWSLTTRRHHCRHCSGIFCSNCSVHRMAIPKFSIQTPVRVCNSCHEALSWPAAIVEVDEDPFDRSYSADEPSYNSTTSPSQEAPVLVQQNGYSPEVATLMPSVEQHNVAFDSSVSDAPSMFDVASNSSVAAATALSDDSNKIKGSGTSPVDARSRVSSRARHIKVKSHKRVNVRHVNLEE